MTFTPDAFEATVTYQVVQTCAVHQAVPAAALPALVLTENRRKNAVFKWFADQEPSLFEGDPGEGRRLKPGVSFVWSYSGEGVDRVLTAEMVGGSPGKRDEARGWALATFGHGTVVLP